jgi:Pyruvate/2-oxoacid:ferredoxin oxidoreductase delta subunit
MGIEKCNREIKIENRTQILSMEANNRKTITLNADLNAVLTGFDSARLTTPAHHRIIKSYASPLLIGPPASDDLLELVMHMFTEDEADLVQHLPPLRPRSAKKVALLSGRPISDVTQVLDSLAFTKQIILAAGEPRKYTILPLLPGTFEMVLMTPDLSTRNTWHKRFAELFERLWDKGSLLIDYIMKNGYPSIRYLPVNGASKTLHAAWPSDRFEEVLEPYDQFAVGNCQCRLAMHLVDRGCDRPLENCVAIGPVAKPIIERGLMRKADRREIIEIKHNAEEHGCVTFIGNAIGRSPLGNGSCSCCGCCCHGLRSISQFNAPGLISKPHFLPVREEKKCTLCRKCINVCPMDAWRVSGKDLQFNTIRCIGCGLCVLACKFGALSLQESDDVRPPQNNWLTFLLKIAPVYLTATVRVWARRVFA